MEPFGVQQRHPSQDPRIEAVGLGVLGVLGDFNSLLVPQVGGLLGRDQDHHRPFALMDHHVSGTQALRVGSITTVSSTSSGNDAQSASRFSGVVRNFRPLQRKFPALSAKVP
jgi:hypothetical protein